MRAFLARSCCVSPWPCEGIRKQQHITHVPLVRRVPPGHLPTTSYPLPFLPEPCPNRTPSSDPPSWLIGGTGRAGLRPHLQEEGGRSPAAAAGSPAAAAGAAPAVPGPAVSAGDLTPNLGSASFLFLVGEERMMGATLGRANTEGVKGVLGGVVGAHGSSGSDPAAFTHPPPRYPNPEPHTPHLHPRTHSRSVRRSWRSW